MIYDGLTPMRPSYLHKISNDLDIIHKMLQHNLHNKSCGLKSSSFQLLEIIFHCSQIAWTFTGLMLSTPYIITLFIFILWARIHPFLDRMKQNENHLSNFAHITNGCKMKIYILSECEYPFARLNAIFLGKWEKIYIVLWKSFRFSPMISGIHRFREGFLSRNR